MNRPLLLVWLNTVLLLMVLTTVNCPAFSQHLSPTSSSVIQADTTKVIPKAEHADQGYYREPTLAGGQVIFVCEDDLWSVPASGGVARRLTAGKGECSMPRLSPDGANVAYVSTEEGNPEVYVMPASGGQAHRLTSLGSTSCSVVTWTNDSKNIVFVSDAGSAFAKHTTLFTVSATGGMPQPMNLGHAKSLCLSADGQVVLGRNNVDPARWKRYRGGTAGELWYASKLDGDYKPLLTLPGNLVWPMSIGSRIYFLSDHQGVGNIYSCAADGSDLRRHTNEVTYYVRYPATDGKQIVYACGAKLKLLDPQTNTTSDINISTPTNPTQRVRKFISARDCIESVAVHPKGHSLLVIARGQPFTMPLWEGAVVQHGVGSTVRYKLADWLADGERFVVVNDAPGYEQVELHYADEHKSSVVVSNEDIGRVCELAVSPTADQVALTNHRQELLLLDIAKKKLTKLDSSPAQKITNISWSPDGRWIAYSWANSTDTRIIRIVEAKTGTVHDVTALLREDHSPCFDPDGKYLYFLSTRDYNPVQDVTQFDLSFPMSERPFVICLRKDTPSPFVPTVRPFVKSKENGEGTNGDKADKKTNKKKEPTKVDIDFDGIKGRMLGFPINPGSYKQIAAAHGRVLFSQFVISPIDFRRSWLAEENKSGSLMAYDFEEQKSITLQADVQDFGLGPDHQTVVYRSRKRIRVMDALKKESEDINKNGTEPSRKTGWIDVNRIKIMIEPEKEWSQIFHEAWRLQKGRFWDKQMSNVDWDLVRMRYEALLPRARTRSDLSDLIWEMQGELGTSHAYEFLGDYRTAPAYNRGFLGADLSYDKDAGGYRIDKILRGDSWDREVDSPLAEPGLKITQGDVIVAVDGQPVSQQLPVDDLLIDHAGDEVQLTVLHKDSKSSIKQAGTKDDPAQNLVVVKTLRDERPLRYRAWVEANRALVHEQSNGTVGYVHIPDMGPLGFSEFHRGYLAEYNYPALIVDIRYNGGGSVSQLLLEKLLRKRVGYAVTRWGLPEPYPAESVAGPMVAVTNQFAGSDGDIFSHCFKLYKLGPLVGHRTWGGVIGIDPNYHLVDGTLTTQPEYSFWFEDVGWKVENYGVDPDVPVDITPQDYRLGRDPQLAKAVELAMKALAAKPVKLPNFDQRPSKALPKELPATAF